MKTRTLVLSATLVTSILGSGVQAATVVPSGQSKAKQGTKHSVKHGLNGGPKHQRQATTSFISGPITPLVETLPGTPLTLNATGDAEDSLKLSEEGDADADRGNWAGAFSRYQRAVRLWADNKQAVYGLGRCAQAAGDIAGALGYYHQRIYTSDPSRYGTVPGDGYQENDVKRLMEYVLLLSQAGHIQEAVSVYNRAANLLDYDPADGHQREKVLLPQFGVGLRREAYTAQELEAMAHLAVGMELFGASGYFDKKPLEQFQKAVDLAPNSAAAHFYLGKYLFGKSDSGAKAELQRAVQLGDDQTAAAAKEYLK